MVLVPVLGTILFIALLIVALVLYLRCRRRRRVPEPSRYPSNDVHDMKAEYSTRPSLRLRIPTIPSFMRGAGPGSSSSILPTARTGTESETSSAKKSSTTLRLERPFEVPELRRVDEEDYESSVVDIRQRPVSGTTMTTRVTVGTTIGNRVSIPDSTFNFARPSAEIPRLPLEFLQANAIAMASRSPQDSSHYTNTNGTTADSWTNFTNHSAGSGYTTAATSVPDAYLRSYGSPSQSTKPPLPRLPLVLPTNPSNGEGPFVHTDGGVRLSSNLPTPSPRTMELPPPYQHYN